MVIVLTPAEKADFIREIAEAVAAKMRDRPKLVDRYDLAKLLSISVPTIERYQAKGVIPVCRLGRLVRYNPEDVIAAIAKHQSDSDTRAC